MHWCREITTSMSDYIKNQLESTLGPFKKYVPGLGGGVKQNNDKVWQGERGSSQRVMSPLQKNIVSTIALEWF